MSRRSTNFPPGIWQARREYDRQRYNRHDSNRMNPTPSQPNSFQVSGLNDSNRMNPTPPQPNSFQVSGLNDSNRMNPTPPHSNSFQNSYREIDPVPWQPVGRTMIARILDISRSPEEPPAIVRIITRSRPGQLEASPRPVEMYSLTPISEGNSTLTSEEQNMALNKLKKKVYDPPSDPSRRINFYYRENDRGNYNGRSNGDSNEEGKRCAVCLEDFQPKEEVMMTPCNHMFHEECIVPWVKSNGQCPVCRFTLFERTVRRGTSSDTVSIAPARSLVDDELVYLIRAMEDTLMLRNLAGF